MRFMNPLIRDLLGHQAWADAELWTAIESHVPARDDPAIRDRLHHTHQVQRAFVWAVGDRGPFEMTRPADFATSDALRAYARESHQMVQRVAEPMSPARLDERIEIPWFTDPPLTLTVGEALTQMAMHSQHHRGQNVTRLRELGGSPPTIDLIVWFWKGRPAPGW
jgi:uncharacterized damage-inducible protein DinB